MSDSESESGRVLELAEEFIERYRKGERPPLREYIDRHPELAAQIKEVFPAMAMMENIAVANESLDDPSQDSGGKNPTRQVLRQLGDYRIIREIGHGGMGIVYEAEQVSLGRHVALKALPDRALLDPKHKRRFEREARAAAKLHHTNIVPVFGVGEHEGLPYYVMQFIQGMGIDAVLDELQRMEPGAAHSLSGQQSGGAIGAVQRNVSAAEVARSLMIGEFQPPTSNGPAHAAGPRTGMIATLDEPARSGAEVCGPEANGESSRSAPDRSSHSTSTGRIADSFTASSSSITLPGSGVSGSKAASKKQNYWQSVAHIGRQVADALAYAHKQGVHHRDIKPSNLLLDLRGTVWVTDFGLAKVSGPGADGDNLTHTGDILGTLRYMPPEAFDGKSDARSDVYSLGLTLYEMLTLRPAYEEKDRHKLIKLVTTGEPAALDRINQQIPRDLVTIIHKAIEREPSQRYATADDLASDLQRFLDDEPILARRQTQVERYVRWARHNPGIATLGAVLTAVLVMATIASLLVAGMMARSAADERIARQQADESGAREAEERKRANDATELTRQNLYSAQMHLAQQAWREHRGLAHMRQLLDNWLPRGDSPDRRGWEWFYLSSLPYQNSRTITPSGRSERPTTVAWHVASKRLAEGTPDGLIRIWDVDREQITLHLSGPAPVPSVWGVRWLAWSPDGGKLAGGCNNGTVHIWDTGSGQELQVLAGHESPVRSVAFGSDGIRLASWGQDGSIKIWDTITGRLTSDVVHSGDVSAGAWSPDDTLLASGHGDGTVSISGARAGDKIVTLRAHVNRIHDMAWSPDSGRLATASGDFTAKVWDVASEKMVLGPLRHSHEIASVAWEPDGQKLATGSIDETIKIWSATTGLEAATLRGHFQTITSLSWGPEARLASGCNDGSVKIWNAIRDQESSVLPGHLVRATSVSWSPDGKRLASGGDDGKIRIWDAATLKEVLAFQGHDPSGVNGIYGLIRLLAWNPDSTHLASAGQDGTAKVWEVASGRQVFALPAEHGAVWSVAWSPDGIHLAAGSEDGTIQVIDGLPQAPKVRSFKAHQGLVCALAWSPLGDRLASGGGGSGPAHDWLVKLWDPIRGAELAHMQGHRLWVLAVSWSPDGKRLASASADRLVLAWDAETGQQLSIMRGHNDFLDSVAWSPDGSRLASAGFDNSVRVWDPRTGEEAFVLRGNSGRFYEVSWHPDGARLAAANSDGQIWIWDATRGFERDTTPRALPYLDRKVAAGAACGQDLLWSAGSYVRAGKPREAVALLKDNPTALLELFTEPPSEDQKAFTRLRPDLETDWLRALTQQPHLARAAFASARSLVQSGVGAFESGRLAEAIRDLQAANDLLRTLMKVNPNDYRLSSNLSTCLGFLGSALRDSHRPVEALVSIQEQRSVLESMRNPDSTDLYNLACSYAQLSVLLQHAATPAASTERDVLADQAMNALRRSLAAGRPNLALMDRDHDLDPLRERPDFRALMLEAGRTHEAAPPQKPESNKK